jgi:two-component system OmpR family response regulator
MRILMIEDDAALARSIGALLRADGHAVDHCASGEEALTLVSSEPYALVILDARAMIDRMAIRTKERADAAGERGIILDHQDSHDDRR